MQTEVNIMFAENPCRFSTRTEWDLDSLIEDIRKNGLKEGITIDFKNKCIKDGYRRWLACMALGYERILLSEESQIELNTME